MEADSTSEPPCCTRQQTKESRIRILRHELPELGVGIIGSMTDVILNAIS
jgi:hypothetical protein